MELKNTQTMNRTKKPIILFLSLFILLIVIIIFVFLKNENNKTSNFVGFQLSEGDRDITTIQYSINTGEYRNRAYYDLFNSLYFKFHQNDNTELIKCLNNKETSQCAFYNAVLNNNEEICNEFPSEESFASPGKYGTTYLKFYYRSSCILNTRMLEKFNSESDKISFCRTFKEQYIVNMCLIYTCESYYWNKEKPEICTDSNINIWFNSN